MLGLRIYRNTTHVCSCCNDDSVLFDRPHAHHKSPVKIDHCMREKKQGEFENGETHGVGRRTWRTGHWYIGEERAGMKEGVGVFCWPEGRRYEGTFSQDRRNGFGIMLWPNGRWYAGFWRDGAKDGEGIECEDEVRSDSGK